MNSKNPYADKLEELKQRFAEIEWAEKRCCVKSFLNDLAKDGKDAYEWFKGLPRKTKKNLLIAAIVITAGAGVAKPVSEKVSELKQKIEIILKKRDIKKHLEEKYEITDIKKFKQLYEDALPLMQLSMLPTECLVLNPYSDNGKKVSNTIGLGSYYYPQNGDPQSSEWIKSSVYFKNHAGMSISGERALAVSDGWYRYRENGRVYKTMYRNLKDTKLNIHEFAAIATVMYNDETKGCKLCKFVHDNYNNPMRCAQEIAFLTANSSFGGIPKRHLHEAYLYLNLDNYAQKMYNFEVKEGINSKNQHYFVTSVTQISNADVADGKAAIKSGDKDRIIAEQNKIVNYISKGGNKIKDIIYNRVLDEELASQLMAFYIPNDTILFEDATQNKENLSGDQMYALALKSYEHGIKLEKEGKKAQADSSFNEALSQFNKVLKNGNNGADLHNDIAVTYYHLGEYQKCIDECIIVLKMGDQAAYPAANYNAGKAYEAQGKFDKALANYKAGIRNGGDEKIFNDRINHLNQKSSPQMNNQKSNSK